MTQKSNEKIPLTPEILLALKQARSDLARAGAAARWKGLNKADRKVAMKKAHRARKATCKKARAEKKAKVVKP